MAASGLIHYNMSDEAQVKELARVKNHIHGFIREPIKVTADQKIGEVLDRIERKHFGFSTFPVVDETNKLLGLLSGSCVKERYRERSGARGHDATLRGLHPAGKCHPARIRSRRRTGFSPTTSAFTSC